MTHAGVLQIICEFLPVFAFFIAAQLLDFVPAVAVLVVTTVVCFLVSLCALRHMPLMPIFSTIIVLITGILTIYFDKPQAIIFADTIYFFAFAGLIAIGFWQRKHFLERIFEATFAVEPIGWRRISQQWLALLILAGITNEYVRLFMTPEFWIDYRFTKVILINIIIVIQFYFARRYRIKEESNTWGFRK